jgi:hypothetical protein
MGLKLFLVIGHQRLLLTNCCSLEAVEKKTPSIHLHVVFRVSCLICTVTPVNGVYNSNVSSFRIDFDEFIFKQVSTSYLKVIHVSLVPPRSVELGPNFFTIGCNSSVRGLIHWCYSTDQTTHPKYNM